MEYIYLFDVDGTLTPPRRQMDENFADFFGDFVLNNKVVLVSGSDYAKLQEQVPENILKTCESVFGCSGAECFERGIKVYSKEHTFSDDLISACSDFIDRSKFPLRTGNHIEFRPGMLNISAVGRNADDSERETYFAWDNIYHERKTFALHINNECPEYEASAGGEISIDIVPKGWNKSVVKWELLKKYPHANLIFFGDKIVEGGNDLPLAHALEEPAGKHISMCVKGYNDTWDFLRPRSTICWKHAS